ncbi:MAG TPA: tRNA (N6-isopentenyl adenosine(37)-C2)-methylthiotransferase MiaB [Acidobacteriota bacterium]|nr:tRNA (N6-isopentenyl adenosine(37)-C2)-methylthiotransferase MiaB [Acidobacteriota bacterium]
MSKRYFIETFGCQMNDLDSEKIAGSLSHEGMEPVSDASEADIIILNTCSVREKAVQKVYARLGEIRQYKAKRRDLLVGVVGCMAQLEKDRILKKAPFVNLVAGPQKGNAMGQLVELSAKSPEPVVDLRTDEMPSPLESPYIMRGSAWRANITISEGCNRQCAFCVVPLTRGKERVRESAEIIREVRTLASKGYVEIVLLGQTVNSYCDRSGEVVNFAELLRRIAGVRGIRRIRFTSPHPSDFSDELLEVMISCPAVCNQIHLPVQSGSSKVLRAMRRGYTRERYLDMIGKIHAAPRPIAISTDIIVGFPGETESDFQDTLSLLDAVQYDSAFSFKYSPRPFTAALNFPDDVPEEEKGRRLDTLQRKQKQIQNRINEGYLGQKAEVLVEGNARSRLRLMGRLSNNKIVNFDGPDALIGRFEQVEITGFSPNSLKGTWMRQLMKIEEGPQNTMIRPGNN